VLLAIRVPPRLLAGSLFLKVVFVLEMIGVKGIQDSFKNRNQRTNKVRI
jgi:hypothetical protein